MSNITSCPKETPTTFPLELLIPKKETQQELFLSEFPEYDGRNIIIAILDTGVDPSLPGLQTTTTGERKLIDLIDCSGAGDVETSTVKSAVDGKIEGLTGRTLNIPPSWTNPSGDYRLGIKPLYQLYSESLKDMITSEQEKEIFDPSHQMATANALRQMAKHEEEIGEKSNKLEDKLEREEYASQIEFLKSMKRADDPGPVADCIVWNDGNDWKYGCPPNSSLSELFRACIDTSFDGRLDLCTPMGSFRKTGDYSKLTDRDNAVYSFRIDEKEGNWLQIVVANDSHGSHVASIAAAHYPDEPKLNGLAPGAKIVSFCIGDNRSFAVSTGTARTRAFNLCAEYGVHVANMSFGGGTKIPNRGRVVEELQKMITKGNIVFVAAAGNSGPALSTVDSPGGTTSGVLGIGSYISPAVADGLHGTFQDIKGNLYPSSSRGPCSDGWLGVSLCAPGAALTGVPKSCRQSNKMMNGTSMSSPNAAGAIACLLSGLKANGQPWTSHQIRTALENTAFSVEGLEPFSQGQGLVQINSAFDYLRKAGSVYLREHYDVKEKKEFSIKIEPTFLHYSDTSKQIEFEKHMLLKCDAPWVSIPGTFFATAKARSFFMEVDPTVVQEGTVAYTEVHGFDSNAPNLGPLFRFPITVIRPNTVGKASKYAIQYNFDAPSGEPVRRFVMAPEQATIVEVKVTSLSEIPQDKFTLQKMYLNDQLSRGSGESHKTLGPSDFEWTHYMPVNPGRTVEFCLTRDWSKGAKPAQIEMDVKFHGMERPDGVVLVHGSASTRVQFSASSYRAHEIKPEIKLNALVLPLRSTTQTIEPLGPGDVFLDGIQVHRMLLTFKLTVTKSTELYPSLPGLSLHSGFSLDCVLVQIFTSTKQFIPGISYLSDGYTHKLEKGEYVIQVQIRHPDPAVLEKVHDVPLHVITKMATPIELQAFTSPGGPIAVSISEILDTKFGKKTANPCEQFSAHFGSVPNYKILGSAVNVTSGCFMTGYMTIFVDPKLSEVDKIPVIYNFTEYSQPKYITLSKITLEEEEEVKNEQKLEMEEAIRDLQVTWLSKLYNQEEENNLYAELIQKYPTYLPLMRTRMKSLMSRKNRTEEELDALNLVIQQILDTSNRNEVLMYLGCKQEFNVDQLSIKKSMEERKDAIIDALMAKANILADSYVASSTLDIPAFFKKELPSTTDLKKITPVPDTEKTDALVTENKPTVLGIDCSNLTIDGNSIVKENEMGDVNAECVKSLIESPAPAVCTVTATENSPLKNIGSNEVGREEPKADPITETDKIDAIASNDSSPPKISDRSPTEEKKTTLKDVDAAYIEVLKWVTPDDVKIELLSAKHAIIHGHNGRALKYLQKKIDFERSIGIDTKLAEQAVIEICDRLGWTHISNQLKNQSLVRHMDKYRPFHGTF